MPEAAKTFTLSEKATGKAHLLREPDYQSRYDRDWERFRAWYASVHPPICVECNRSLPSPQMHLDHITPLTGADDPTRLDESAVQWLCASCHRRKTNAEQ